MRDALHLLRPGERPGPLGEVYQCWRRAVERPASRKTYARALPDFTPDRIAGWLAAGQGAPVMRAAAVLEVVLEEAPRANAAALILADAVLAQALGWNHLLPLLASGLKGADLHKRGAGLRLACHRAAAASVIAAASLAADLVRRATHLTAVVPTLRAKGAAKAVDMFLMRPRPCPCRTGPPSGCATGRLCESACKIDSLGWVMSE